MLLNNLKNLSVVVMLGLTCWAAPVVSQPIPSPLLLGTSPDEQGGAGPEVELTGEILFQILAADFAAQRGAWATATSTALEVSRITRDPRLARRALEFALAGDNLPRAWDAARLWRELAPADPEAEQAEIMLAAANGDTSNLGFALEKQLTIAEDKAEAILQTQQILSRLSDKRRAFDLLDQLLGGGDLYKLPEARAALAQSAFEAGEGPRALQEIRAALRARPDWELAAGMRLQFGMPLEPERTLLETRAFIEKHPDSRDLRLALVGALMERGDYDAATAEIKAMSRHAPEDFELLYLHGAIAYEAGQTAQAEKLLRDYIQVESRRRQASDDDYDPTSSLADAQLLLARIAEEDGRYDQAYDILNGMTSPEVRFVARLRQAAVRAKQGRVDESLSVLDAARPMDEREEIMLALTRSQILRETNRLPEAARTLQGSIAALPDSTELRYELAMLLERLDRIPEMEQQLRQIISIDPNHAHAYNALGYTLADRNMRLDEAASLIERALSLQPNDASIIDSMGWLKYRQGDYEAAISYLRRSWELSSEAEVGVHLGEALWMNGDKEEARKVWQAVAALDADNPVLEATLKRLGVQP